MRDLTKRPGESFVQRLLGYQNIGVAVSLAAIVIIGLIFTPDMFTFGTIMQLLKANTLYGIVAIGVMFVLLTGGIDLSTGAILSLSCNTLAALQVAYPGERIPLIALIALSIFIGLACGLLNGVLVGVVRIHPMLATLGSQYIFLFISYYIRDVSVMANLLYKSVRYFTSTKLLGVYVGVWIMVALYIAVGLILQYTRLGRKIYAIGSNRASAAVAGIKSSHTQLTAYTLCGMCCGLAGFMYLSNFSYATFNVSGDFAMKAICIAVLGGVSPSGGKGRIDGMFISILVISLINYFTNLIPNMGLWSDAFYGLLVVGALFMDAFVKRRKAKKDLERKEAAIDAG